MNALDIFHPIIAEWFSTKVGTPTKIQTLAWPVISQDKHVLITAPTGSGKTMTAFLWGLNQLITGEWPLGSVRILYISPLKALNNDIQRNLLKPLSELEQVFTRRGERFPMINVLTRSGDTPGEERRMMLRRPPEILITTPESLNILLTSKSGRKLFNGISTVILDEIHAIVDNKRGTHLITAVERIVPLSGEFQRIAISATVRPLEEVAFFVGGYTMTGSGREAVYKARPVEIISSGEKKNYEIKIHRPESVDLSESTSIDDKTWPVLAEDCKKIINSNKSTLIFTNMRARAEKTTRYINENEPGELAYSHHGSLSREIRLAVEEKMKSGELKAIVATNTLELGIDIGHLDQVILIETPLSISSAIQRIGRSGHIVGETSRGTFFSLHGLGSLGDAVMARAILDQEIEAVNIIKNPLDLLAQVILSMTAYDKWDIDDLYSFLRTSYPYHDLEYNQFELVLEMLAGRYANSRVKELKPRIHLDRIDRTVRAMDNIPFLIYLSGGTIANRGYFDIRISDTKAKIGELDEEMVWERKIGDTFYFGNQIWRIVNITHNDVEVIKISDKAGMIPFWVAEPMNQGFFFSEKIGMFLEMADEEAGKDSFTGYLAEEHCMEKHAAGSLRDFLIRQKNATRTPLPHRHNLVIEHYNDPFSRSDMEQIILHTMWGGMVNQPFAIAIAAVLDETLGVKVETVHRSTGILVTVPASFDIMEIFRLVTPDNIEYYMQKGIELTGIFGSRFRENAECALLLPKHSHKRTPLWMNRLRAKNLFQTVRGFGDFPVIIETWRSCLREDFDIETLKLLLQEVSDGIIRISEARTTTPSPFTGDLIYLQTNYYMYDEGRMPAAGRASITDEIIRQLLQTSHLRPKIPEEIMRSFDEKLKRIAPGYAPATPPELLDWIKERLLIPENEWEILLQAVGRDSQDDPFEIYNNIKDKTAKVSLPDTDVLFIAALELLPQIAQVFPGIKINGPREKQDIKKLKDADWSLTDFLYQWISYYPVIEINQVQKMFGIRSELLLATVEELNGEQKVLVDKFGEASLHEETCRSENLEILLRILRRSRQPSFETLPVEKLPLFIAHFQGLAPRGVTIEDLQTRLEQLFGWPASAPAWEEILLPSRIKPYYLAWMDSLMQTSDLTWFGCGKTKTSLGFFQDLELFQDNHKKDLPELNDIFEENGKYTFLELTKKAMLESRALIEKVWSLAWKGRLTNDTYHILRRGILNNYAVDLVETMQAGRGGVNRWRSNIAEGRWYRLDPPPEKNDIIEQEELVKDRIRQLFKRYGILFREILAHELHMLQWRNIFRSLRLMEFSGEVLSGHFFDGIPGLQFMSQEAFRILQKPLDEDCVFWINALDPASLCGVQIEGLKAGLPSRITSNYLVYEGSKVVMLVKKTGKDLHINAEPENPRLHDYLGIFRDLINREFNPVSRIVIEKINDQPVIKSPYIEQLRKFGFRSNGVALELWKGY